ncbi:BA14K family protein [Stappia sp. TSB10GB4]|uniref:BA14K family protein n=1 Tax=Stappia sp. TSB10GB4 TaxID=2003584 RepID=UPI001AD90584|nr:BA14K family protein [Stappia sp. TSB10GB4]
MAANTDHRAERLISWAVRGVLVAVLALAVDITAPRPAAAETVIPVGSHAGQHRGGQYRGGQYRGGRHWGGHRTHRHYRPQRHYRVQRHYRPYRDDWNYRYGGSGVYFGGGAATVFGLAAGAILGQALVAPQYVAPPRAVRGAYAPWTPQWYAYCTRKYRSFNPNTGYYLAYSGRYRFCR